MENKINNQFDKLIDLIENIKIGSELSLARINEFKDTVGILIELYNDNILEIKQNTNNKKELEINSFVIFDEESCTKDEYDKYYKELFPLGKMFVYLGEIKHTDGQCILCDLNTGKITGMCHTENFREAIEDEY